MTDEELAKSLLHEVRKKDNLTGAYVCGVSLEMVRDAIPRIRKLLAPETCEWTLRAFGDSHQVGCKANASWSNDRSPSFIFCPYCGGKIVEVKAKTPGQKFVERLQKRRIDKGDPIFTSELIAAEFDAAMKEGAK